MVRQAVTRPAAQTSIQAACDWLAYPRSRYYRQQQTGSVAESRPPRPSPRALPPVERAAVRDILNSDRFSRYVVGYLIAEREQATLARQLVVDSCAKQGIEPDQLILHADRGGSMTSKTLALLLADLGVGKSHSRPYTSNDNPFSEAQFKTMKYRPDYPDRFGGLQDARAWARPFFHWYNHEHRHTSLGLMTPATLHYGLAEELTAKRQTVLTAAYAQQPERFVQGQPVAPKLAKAVWINPPQQAGDEQPS